jgi:Schlafen, AlbA_2
VTVDLYRDDLAALPDAQLSSAIEAFCRIGDPIQDRPREDYRLDFKEEWKEKALRVVASFANTFGGLLFIGVTEEGGKPKEILGVQSQGEIKTKIASSIASNISPTPPYDIGECALAGDGTKRLCVVRVRRGAQLYFLTTKGESNPVYIRNADESRPAQAAELRALIEQRPVSVEAGSDFSIRIAEWRDHFGVTKKLETQPDRSRTRSPTYFKVVILPLGRSRLILDQALEEALKQIVGVRYPGVSALLPLAPVIELDEDRGRDWYRLRWLHTNLDYERSWRVNSRADFGFATQTKYPLAGYGDCWSLCDIALGLISTLTAAKSWWEAFGYFGDARLIAWLDVQMLKLHQLEKYPYGFAPLFYNRSRWPETGKWPPKFAGQREYPFSEADTTLAKDVLTISEAQSNGNAVAQVDLNYASLRTDELPEIVALVMNQFIRSLGHVANLKRLRQETANLPGEPNP